MKSLLVLLVLFAFALNSCVETRETVHPIKQEAFNANIGGQAVTLYTLKNTNGVTVELTNYGARIVSIWVPDNKGNFRDVIWGHATIEDYKNTPVRYANPIVGRVANRIAKGQFTLDEHAYQLSLNSKNHHLHGGTNSFEAQVWKGRVIDENRSVEMSLLSPDGQDGYPGNLQVKVVYSLSDDNKLTLHYTATTDGPTLVNPTTHAMFNLSGTTDNSILNHDLQIAADSILVMDAEGIPTGERLNIKNTPLDFKKTATIGERIDTDYTLLQQAKGYDHYYIFDKNLNANSPKAAVSCPTTGIKLTIYTDQLGMQAYTGNFFGGTVEGKRGDMNNHRSVIALECQNYPDAINHVDFPSIVLRPGETYQQVTTYAFSVISE